MNKTDIVEIMSKRTTKLALLSVVFVGMMVALVPMIIEEVDARTNAKATSLIGPFSNVKVEETIHGASGPVDGIFEDEPMCMQMTTPVS